MDSFVGVLTANLSALDENVKKWPDICQYLRNAGWGKCVKLEQKLWRNGTLITFYTQL